MYKKHGTHTVRHLFEVILSNGFSRLRICTAVGIGTLAASGTWSGSPVLRILHLDMETTHDYEQLRSACPNLRRFTSFGLSGIHPSEDISKSMYAIRKSYLINSSIMLFQKDCFSISETSMYRRATIGNYHRENKKRALSSSSGSFFTD